MKSSRLLTYIQRFLGLRYAPLTWWTERSWKFRVQFIIGLTALSLLLLSLFAWFTYEKELAKISNRFLRLQIFGPQEIFYSSNSVKDAENGETVNFCQFHIETKLPYGRALPNARIKATFLTPDGTPFWVLSDRTCADGTFRFPPPDMPMPERVTLRIHAEAGARDADFVAFLKTKRIDSASNAQSVSEPETDFVFEDKPLESVIAEVASLPQNSSVLPSQTSFTLSERVLSSSCVHMSVTSKSSALYPLFLGVWHGDRLLACRPFVANEQPRKTSLMLPEGVCGTLSVLLIDASISPPKVLQHELVYRLPTFEASQSVAQLQFLQDFALKMNTAEFRAKKQRIEHLPRNLENPNEKQLHDPRLTSGMVSAASRLLGNALAAKITSERRYYLPELTELNRVVERLNHCVQAPQAETKTEADALKSLVRLALRYESCILNQNLASSTVRQSYVAGTPIIFDGLSALESAYQDDIRNFRTNTQTQLGSIACLILCCALCLVFIMVLMSILGLPTDWRIWILTLGVVLSAFLLAWLIANQSDLDRHHANIRYAIFTGTEPLETTDE